MLLCSGPFVPNVGWKECEQRLLWPWGLRWALGGMEEGFAFYISFWPLEIFLLCVLLLFNGILLHVKCIKCANVQHTVDGLLPAQGAAFQYRNTAKEQPTWDGVLGRGAGRTQQATVTPWMWHLCTPPP